MPFILLKDQGVSSNVAKNPKVKDSQAMLKSPYIKDDAKSNIGATV